MTSSDVRCKTEILFSGYGCEFSKKIIFSHLIGGLKRNIRYAASWNHTSVSIYRNLGAEAKLTTDRSPLRRLNGTSCILILPDEVECYLSDEA